MRQHPQGNICVETSEGSCLDCVCHLIVKAIARLLLIRRLLCHAPDCFPSNERWDVFILGSEDIPDVGDGSCMLGVELVMCLTTRLICVLLELTDNANDVVVNCNVRISERHGCLGCDEHTTHTTPQSKQQARQRIWWKWSHLDSGSDSRVKGAMT